MGFGTNFGNGTGYGPGYPTNFGTQNYDNLPLPANEFPTSTPTSTLGSWGDDLKSGADSLGGGVENNLYSLAGGLGDVSKLLTDPSGAANEVKDVVDKFKYHAKTAFDNTASSGYGEGTEEEQTAIENYYGLNPNNKVGYVNGQPENMNPGLFT